MSLEAKALGVPPRAHRSRLEQVHDSDLQPGMDSGLFPNGACKTHNFNDSEL